MILESTSEEVFQLKNLRQYEPRTHELSIIKKEIKNEYKQKDR